MKRPVIIVILIVVLGLVALVAVAAVGGSRLAKSRESSPSSIDFTTGGQSFVARRADRPDGSFVVEILDATTNTVLIRSSRSANPIMRWSLVEDGGKVWFTSSDFGMLVFIQSAGVWEEVAWIPGKPSSSEHPLPDAVFEKLSARAQRELAPYHQPTGK